MISRLLFGRFFLSILLIAVLFSPVGLAGKKKLPAQPVNINTANSEQLQLVPGIGPATADKILQMRKSYGANKSVDDLLAIRGLGPKRLEKMRKYLTVGKAVASKPAPHVVQPALKPPPSFRRATTGQTVR
jgi:competence ComEA-like helix-hairpin-helix protein